MGLNYVSFGGPVTEADDTTRAPSPFRPFLLVFILYLYLQTINTFVELFCHQRPGVANQKTGSPLKQKCPAWGITDGPRPTGEEQRRKQGADTRVRRRPPHTCVRKATHCLLKTCGIVTCAVPCGDGQTLDNAEVPCFPWPDIGVL